MTWWEKKVEKKSQNSKTNHQKSCQNYIIWKLFWKYVGKKVRNIWWHRGRSHALAACATSSSVETPPLLMALDTSRWDLVGDATCVSTGYA
jgi:hypothetical protein